ncbi:MAG: SDR family oxidoreductase [Myxococcota bacterium]|jgi:NAD(P)-dependent dehydrogenase (short-subunit alcohol dehydrogenase family)|nr:SDR family oxidoreductase [Myxococcota bacterium]
MSALPVLEGRVVVVTGATSGIGRHTFLALAETGATMVAVARDEKKARVLMEEASAGSGSSHHFVLGDFLDQSQVRGAAAEVLAQHDRIDLLVNNAGALFSDHQHTVDGYERTWALNHLAYFLFTDLLLDAVKRGAPSRIVNVASRAHERGRMHWDDLQLDQVPARGGWAAYGQSKLANILFTRALARRLDGSGVMTCAVHPGWVNTGFGMNNGWGLRTLLRMTRPLQRTTGHGAETVLWASTCADVEPLHGRYLADLRVTDPSAEAQSDDAAERLWTISEDMVGARRSTDPES